MECKTSSRYVRGGIGVAVGGAVGEGLSIAWNQLQGKFATLYSIEYNAEAQPKVMHYVRLFGLPVLGAAVGGYIGARKPQCGNY